MPSSNIAAAVASRPAWQMDLYPWDKFNTNYYGNSGPGGFGSLSPSDGQTHGPNADYFESGPGGGISVGPANPATLQALGIVTSGSTGPFPGVGGNLNPSASLNFGSLPGYAAGPTATFDYQDLSNLPHGPMGMLVQPALNTFPLSALHDLTCLSLPEDVAYTRDS